MASEAFLADRLCGMRLAGTILPHCLKRRVLSQVASVMISMPVVAALPMFAQAAVGTASAPADSAHYRRCLADSGVNPAAALADAEGWIKSGGRVPAEHCAALALITFKRYAEAGARLDRIAGGRAALNAEFRVALFDQAGNAWLLAGDGARAVQSFSGALALSAGDADLFADLARAQAMRRDWQEVVM